MKRPQIVIFPILLLLAVIGCSETPDMRDQRLAEFAQQAYRSGGQQGRGCNGQERQRVEEYAGKSLSARMDGATVTVQVRRYDATQTRLAVSAKKWGFYDADEANTIITLIKRNLDR